MNLSGLAAVFLNAIIPVVIIAGWGFILARVFAIDSRTLSQVSLYLFIPVLVFASTYRFQLDGEFVAIGAFSVAIVIVMGALTFLSVKLMRYDRMTASAFALCTLFVNAGNYGLPINFFAFGDEGLERAMVFFLFVQILQQTVAVFIAAQGTMSAWKALLNVFRMPLVYAAVLGLALNYTGFMIPELLMDRIDFIAGAAIPVMLIILGIELSHAKLGGDQGTVALAATIKLVITPIAAFALAAMMGLQGVTRAVCILQASMPTGVMMSILAVAFKVRPQFVASVVLASTLASVVSLAILLGFV